MARLRDSWRTSLPVAQQPRNPQSESIARNRYQTLYTLSDDATEAHPHASSLEPDLFRAFVRVTHKSFAQNVPALFIGGAQQDTGPLPHCVGTSIKEGRIAARLLVDQHARGMIPGHHLPIQGKVVVPGRERAVLVR